MTTIVNNPAPASESSGGFGLLIGIVLLIGFVAILLYFGLPALKRTGPVQVNVPAPEVVMPDKIDVNVNQAK